MRNKSGHSVLHALVVCCVLAIAGLSANAQSYYLFDSYMGDDSKLELLDEDGDGWYTGLSTLSNGRSNNFLITTSATPITDSETATFYGPTSVGSAPTNVLPGAELDVFETTYYNTYGDKDCFRLEPIDFKIAKWEIAFNPTQMKARFNYVYNEVEAPDELYLVDYETNFGKAVNDGNGVFKFKGVIPNNSRYPSFGFTDTANPAASTITIGTRNYNPNLSSGNVVVELNTTYTWGYCVYASINDSHDAFIINTTSKKYDITLDWNAKTVVFSDYVPEAPETLYVVNYNVSYGSATRQTGNIYEFRGVELKSIYKDYGFADMASPGNANFVISAVAAASATTTNRVQPVSGVAYPWAFSTQDKLNSEAGTFDLPTGTYDITLDWDNQTVTFNMLPPTNLYVIAYGNQFGSAAPDEDGIYTYSNVHLNSSFHCYGFSITNPGSNQTPAWVLEPYPYSSTAPNVEPVSGTDYPWVFSTYDAVDMYHGSFFIEDGYYNISLDWYNKTVTFTRLPDPAPAKLWVVNYSTQYGSAEPDENGIFRFSEVTLSSAYIDYGFANNFNPQNASLILSAAPAATASAANRVSVQLGTSYTFYESNWDMLNAEKGTFDIESGTYDIVLDWYAKTVTFNKPKVKAPNTLYFNNYNNKYGSATKGEGNIYLFEDVTTPSNSQYPYYGFSPKVNPGGADWVIVPDMTGIETDNLLVELNTPYPVIIVEDNVMNSDRNSFQVGANVFDVTLDWDNMTVTFSQKEKEMPETLWLGRTAKVFASADAVDGVFTFKNVKIFRAGFETASIGFFNNETPSDADVVIGATINTLDLPVTLNTQYDWIYSVASAIANSKGGFETAVGEYNVTLDWNTKKVTFSAPDLPEAPERLWLFDDSNTFGNAYNVDGVFTFEAVAVTGSNYPYFGFANSGAPRNASLVFSAAPSASATTNNNVNVELGVDYPIYLSNFDCIYNTKGSFIIPDGTYDIVLDYNNATVRFSKPAVHAPETLYASDNWLNGIYGYGENDGSDIFEFTVNMTIANRILVFTDSDALKADGTAYFGSNGSPVTVEAGTTYDFAPTNHTRVDGDNSGFRLPVGLYRVTVDFNTATIVFNETDAREIREVAELNDFEDGDKVTICRDWAVVYTLGNDIYVYDSTSARADHVGHMIKVTAAAGLDEITAGALLSGIKAEVAVDENGTKSLVITNCTVKANAHSLSPLDVAVNIQTTKKYDGYTEFEYFEMMKEHQIVNLRGLVFNFTPDAEGKQFAGLFNSLEVKNDEANPIYIRMEWKGALSGTFPGAPYNVVGIVGPEYTAPAAAPARVQYIDGNTYSTRKVYALAINPYDGESGTTAVENVLADPNAAEEWFTIQGIRVENPTPGNTYIRVANGVASKVLVK